MDTTASPGVVDIEVVEDGGRAWDEDGKHGTTQITASLESPDLSTDPEDDFPEGGLRAWSVVAGAFLVLLPSFGFMVSIGTVQNHLMQNQLSHYSARDVGWIPSVFVYLALGLGIGVGPLFDRYGPKWLALLGSTGYLVMMFTLAECQTYWQFMLCMGVLGGVTGATLTTTSLACVAHWFKRRRGLTQGIAMIGSSSGGLCIPLILRTTLPHYGYAWSIRILGFLFLVCLVIGNTILRARIPPSKTGKHKKLIDLSIYKRLDFGLLTISVFMAEVVLFGSLGIVPTYITLSTAFPGDTGFYLIAVMNGVSSVSRLVSGLVSDYYGRFNTFLVSMVVALIAMLAIWLPFGQTHLGALYAFFAIFGCMTGTWMASVHTRSDQILLTDTRHWHLLVLDSCVEQTSSDDTTELATLSQASPCWSVFPYLVSSCRWWVLSLLSASIVPYWLWDA